MTEAYKVGITIALTNQISRALGLIQGDLVKTDAKAIKLKSTLSEIKKLGVMGAILGGAGYAGLRVLDKAYDAAKEYQQAFAQFKSLKLGDAINSQADKFARGAGIIGASATDLMLTARDLTAVLGDRGQGIVRQLAPGFAQLKYANQAVYGGHGLDFNEKQLRDLERIIEMKGGFKSAPDFLAQAGMMQQVIAGTGGMVKPSDYLNFIKTAGVAGRLLDNNSFYYGMEPLIQEMGGNRVGTGLMSAYMNLAQGRSTVRAAKEMMRLGLVDPSMVEYDKIGQIKRILPGALKGSDQFGSDPYQWMKAVLLPAMRAKGITSEKDILNEFPTLLGNRTGSSLFSLMFLQQDKIEKNMAMSKGAMGIDDLVKLAKSTPEGGEKALGAAWMNVKIAAGEALTPVIVPGLLKLAEAFNWLGKAMARHPIRFDVIIYGFTALSAALAFSGIVLTLKAAFLGLTLVMPSLGTAITATVLPAIGTLTGALGLLALAAAPIIYRHEIADQIDDMAPGIGDFLYKATTPSEWGSWRGQAGNARNKWLKEASAGQSGNKTIQVNSQLNVDGRTIARAVTDHQYYDMNRDLAAGSGFDGRLSFTSPGVP